MTRPGGLEDSGTTVLSDALEMASEWHLGSHGMNVRDSGRWRCTYAAPCHANRSSRTNHTTRRSIRIVTRSTMQE